MFTRSIRWRLQFWQASLLLCILTGFGVTAYQLHRTNRFSQIDEELERRVVALAADVRGRPPFGPPPGFRPLDAERATNRDAGEFGPPPLRPPFDPDWDPGFPRRGGPEGKGRRGGPDESFENREIRLGTRTLILFEPAETNDFYYAVWSRRGSLLKRSTNGPVEVHAPKRAEAAGGIHRRTDDTNREAYQFTEIGECILVGRPIAADLAALQRFAGWLVAAGVAVLALGLGGGSLMATRALRPVEDISAAASRISLGNLDERIDVAETDSELGRLAGVLNSTFARLEAAFAQQKQFIADASHELRTPIAVLLAETQTALARPRTATEYRDTLEGCLETAQQMRRLTESLLELARLEAGQAPIQRHPVDLAETVRLSAERLRSLALERGIVMHCDLAAAHVSGDADRLDQVVTNLLSNAIHYNRPQGQIRVIAGTENGRAFLTVADTGVGIGAADLPHIFDRFYRADAARGGAGGRTGLGLAISKAIVEAHAGTIEASSEVGVGTTFTVRLPAAAPPAGAPPGHPTTSEAQTADAATRSASTDPPRPTPRV